MSEFDPNTTWAGRIIDTYVQEDIVEQISVKARELLKTRYSIKSPDTIALVFARMAGDKKICLEIAQSVTFDAPLTCGMRVHEYVRRYVFERAMKEATEMFENGEVI